MIVFLRKLVFFFMLCVMTSVFSFAEEAEDFFRVEERSGVWWLISPDGKPFFSNGVNVVGMGNNHLDYSKDNPEYAAFLYYRNEKHWQEDTLRRLKLWNFNTIGGWSNEDIEKRGEMPYVKTFWWGEKLIPFRDVFSKETERVIYQKAKEEVLPLKDDRNLIGYFTDNELKWWDDAVFHHFIEQPRENKTRQVLMRLLMTFYENNIKALKEDFETDARSFRELIKRKNCR